MTFKLKVIQDPESTLLDHPLEFQAEMNLLLVILGGGLEMKGPRIIGLTYESQLIDAPGPFSGPGGPVFTSSKFISAWNSRGWPKSVFPGLRGFRLWAVFEDPESTLLGHPLEFQAEVNLLLVTTGPSGPENGPRTSINWLPQVTHTIAGIPLLQTCKYTS